MRWMLLLVALLLALSLPCRVGAWNMEVIPSTEQGFEGTNATMPDPFEPVNRAFFGFNDRFYYWVLRPAAKGYSKVVPEAVRRSIDNFLYNLFTPVRMINDLLQLKLKKFVKEFARFLANTTVGVGGLFDPAAKWYHLPRQDEDMGQTFGVWGVGEVAYIDWPVLGPSCVRDSAGDVGDTFIDPLFYLLSGWYYFGIKTIQKFNSFSFNVDQYDEIKQESFDPYISIRNMYYQHRRHLIRE